MKRTDSITIARFLLVAEITAMIVSTSAAVGLEFLIYLCFILSPALWKRLHEAWQQPMVRGAAAWAAILLCGALYSAGGLNAAIDDLGSWRKLLLLPLAAALFDDDTWKERISHTLIITATVGVALSFFSKISGIAIYKYPVGISVHNHATQGMVFAVSLFAIIAILVKKRPRKAWYGWFLAAAALATMANLVLITDGRSGYLVLLVLTACASLFLARGKWRWILAVVAPLAIVLLLALSPTSRNRINQGVNEAENYRTDQQLTSMGIRMAMWKNTLALIAKSPLYGYGTGGFDEAYRRQVAGKTGWQNSPAGSPHNQFLRIIAEQGIIGLIVFLLFLATMLRQQAAPPYRLMALAVLLAWCGTSMFTDHFSTFFEGRFIYLWCGALLASHPTNQQ